jgi:2-keto-4-pentenoate hydratase
MLSSVDVNRYAHQLLEARALSQLLPPLSSASGLTVEEAYQITHCIMALRSARGERLTGRKIDFANRKVWPCFGMDEALHGPIWAPLFETTVRNAHDNGGMQSLEGAVQPRIEPGIVFGLGTTPPPDADLDAMARSIEWMAHGIEIVVCPYPDWKFNAADAIAAFGLHGTLIIGERRHLSAASRHNLAMLLSAASVSLSCSGDEIFTLRGAGFGADVFGSPVHALLQLHRQLTAEPQFPALAAGDIVATGSWTNPFPVEPGQTWSTAFSGLTLPGMSISFV